MRNWRRENLTHALQLLENKSPSGDPDPQDHWRGEIRAWLERLRRLAKRLPTRQADALIQQLDEIEQTYLQ